MAQPSEWAKNILEAKRQAELKEDNRAELRARDERMLRSKATELWLAIVGKLKADCELLNCKMSDIPLGETMGQSAVRLQGNGTTVRMVSAQFDLDGRLIRIVRFRIKNAVEVFESKEAVNLKLENDEVVFLLEDLSLYTAEQVSNHIMASIVSL